MSHTGTAALRMLAGQVGLTGGLSAALAQPRLLVHDRGCVFGDLALVIVDGASTIGGIDVLGESAELYGPVASVPTAWRTLAEIADGGAQVTDRITRAVNTTGEHVWDLIYDQHGGLPGVRVAARTTSRHCVTPPRRTRQPHRQSPQNVRTRDGWRRGGTFWYYAFPEPAVRDSLR